MPEKYLEQLNNADKMRHRLRKIIIGLSFAVIMAVFWGLKLTGIGVLLFTVLGGGTAPGTGVVLVTKKRMSKIEDEE